MNGTWYAVEQKKDMATTAELLFLDCGEKLEERANWNPEYGKLPDGRYRLIRTVFFLLRMKGWTFRM